MSIKNSNDTMGNRTRDLVAQCLNQMRHRVPYVLIKHIIIFFKNKKLFGACNSLHSHGPTVKESCRSCTQYSYLSAQYKIAWKGFTPAFLQLVLFPWWTPLPWNVISVAHKRADIRAAMAHGLLCMAWFLRATSHDQYKPKSKAVIHFIVLVEISSTLAS